MMRSAPHLHPLLGSALALLLLVLLAPTSEAARQSSRSLRGQYQEGKRAFQARDYLRAAQLWIPVARKKATPALWTRVGLALERAGRSPKARGAYQRALKLDPNYARAREGLDRLAPPEPSPAPATPPPSPTAEPKPAELAPPQEVERRIRISEDLLHQVGVQADPDLAASSWDEGHRFRKLSRYPRAILAFVQAYARGYARSEVDYYLGRTCMEDERIPSALLHLQRARTAVPEDQGIHLQLGKAYGLLGDSQRQIESLEQALSLDPRYAEAHYLVALAYDRVGDAGKVVSHSQKAIRLDPGLLDRLRRGLKDGKVLRELSEGVRSNLNRPRGEIDPTEIDGYATKVAELLYGDSPLAPREAEAPGKPARFASSSRIQNAVPAAAQSQGFRKQKSLGSRERASEGLGQDSFGDETYGDDALDDESDFVEISQEKQTPGQDLGMDDPEESKGKQSSGVRSDLAGGSPPPPPLRTLSDTPPRPSAPGAVPVRAAPQGESIGLAQEIEPNQETAPAGRASASSSRLRFGLMRKIFQDLHAGKGRRAFEHIPHQERAAFLRTFLTKLRQSPSLDPIRLRVEAALRE